VLLDAILHRHHGRRRHQRQYQSDTGEAEVVSQANELRQIAKGGASGTIMGRNAFQRSRKDGVELLKSAIQIFGGK